MQKPIFALLFALSPFLHAKETAPLAIASTEMADAAKAFLASLDEAQAKKAHYDFKDDERENWGFVPKTRNGIPFGELKPEQLALARKLLETSVSQAGLTKIDAIRTLEGWLREIEQKPDFRNPENYFTTIFGEPSATGTWGWRYEGHHTAFNFTITDGKAIAVTPTFLGTNPGDVKEGRLKGLRALAKEEDLGRSLAVSLSEAGKPVVYTEKPPGEILTAADRQIKQLDPVGIPGAEMTDAQKDNLLALISEYANRFRSEIATQDIAQAKAELSTLQFAWAGSLKLGEAYYYRIQGKSFLIEACNIQNDANHVHTVWRDREGDFGRDALGDHMRDHKE
jgi:hypothetical protein